MKSNSSLSKLIPVMLCFFAMGFVDLVPDLLCADRYVDEPYRTKKDGTP